MLATGRLLPASSLIRHDRRDRTTKCCECSRKHMDNLVIDLAIVIHMVTSSCVL